MCHIRWRQPRFKKCLLGANVSTVMSYSATTWTVAHQPPLSMKFSRQEYWSGLPCPPPGDLPTPGIKPMFPAVQADSLPSEPPGARCSAKLCLHAASDLIQTENAPLSGEGYLPYFPEEKSEAGREVSCSQSHNRQLSGINPWLIRIQNLGCF